MVETDKGILLIPEKTDIESEQVLKAWTDRGGSVKRLGKYWIKEEDLDNHKIAIYGNQIFALVLSQVYNVTLISPDDKLISKPGKIWTKRDIEIKTVAGINDVHFPVFIKPVVPKKFIAAIYKNPEAFEQATRSLEKTEEIIISPVIDDIRAEARGYLRNGLLKDIALYEGNADIKEGELFLQNFAEKNSDILPEVVVTDIAYSEKLGWFILEFNACWGAGLNNCKADKVIECIIEATKPPSA